MSEITSGPLVPSFSIADSIHVIASLDNFESKHVDSSSFTISYGSVSLSM